MRDLRALLDFVRRHWILVLIVAVALAVALWGSRWRDGPFPAGRVGSIGEWLGAAGAAFAAIAALHIARTGDRNREERERTVAARSVVATDSLFGRNGLEFEYRFAGLATNFGTAPVRSVRALAEWTVDVRRPDGGLVDAYVASVLGPGATRKWNHKLIAEPGLPSGITKVSRTYGLRFIDVHGDQWEAAFGPGENASVRRLNNRSGFWNSDATDWSPPLEPPKHD